MEKVLLEYEQCHWSRINNEVTITSMVITESNEAVASGEGDKKAFDCDHKAHCGVLTILGKERLIDWTECSHPDLLAGSGSID